MKLGAEDKKKLGLLAVVGTGALIAIYFLYGTLFGGPSTPAPVRTAQIAAVGPVPARVVSTATGTSTPGASPLRVGSGGNALDPTLHMEAMQRAESLVYTGSGRNIFAAPGSPEALAGQALVKAKFPARPKGPGGVAPAIYTGPPPPPPIDLKFFGTVTSANGTLKAFLLNGDNVFLALPGDVVDRRYRVVSIGANSVAVKDLANDNQQTLPLLNTP